jgi:enoyl-CoA hydratase
LAFSGNKEMNVFQTLIFDKINSIAWVTLNRAQVLNVYNIRMRDELWEVLSAIRDDSEIHVGVFCGAGDKAFCAGADLSEFLTAPSPILAQQARWGRDVWGLFLDIPQPLIAAVHGYVLGSGLEIALCCDLRISSEEAQFGFPEAGLGIIPAAGGTQTLVRTVGRAHALEMLFCGRLIGAREAWRMGLINQVVARDELLEAARAMARKIASFNSKAVRLAKKALVTGLDLPIAEGLDLERRLAGELRTIPSGIKRSKKRAMPTDL